MSYGIGAGGLVGVALEVLEAPESLAGTAETSGGTLADDTYFYYVTAVNDNGETTVSNEEEVELAGGSGSGSIDLTWDIVTGADTYNIYRGTATGTEELLDSSATNSYTDDGSETPDGAFPTVNTATDPGTYREPTKFIPITSESLQMMEDTQFRRPIRQSADVIGAVAGNEHVEGDISMEALEDCILYFLLASRTTVERTGSSPNFVYTFEPAAFAVAQYTLSITVIRSDEVFGYTGCTTGRFTFGINNGMLTFTVGIIGRDEEEQDEPSSTWPTTVPFGAGQYAIEIPTGSAVTDTDTFEWSVEDNAEAQFRLKDSGRGAEFVRFGERDVTCTMARDFLTRADYDLFKSVTSQSMTLEATKGTDNSISMLTPVTFKESYEVGLSGQGDLVRANISYRGTINSSGIAYQLVIASQEDISSIFS